jgi:hypothetical protein
MNIAMEQTEEYVNGILKNKYGDAFIRGNNGTSSSQPALRRLHQRRELTPGASDVHQHRAGGSSSTSLTAAAWLC